MSSLEFQPNCSLSWQGPLEAAFQSPGTLKKTDKIEQTLITARPLGYHSYSVATQVCKIAGRIFGDCYETGKNLFDFTYSVFTQFQFLTAVLVPFKVYNIIRVCKSNDLIQNKAVDIAVELGGLFYVAVSITTWFSNNVVKNIGATLPYLVGVSTLFGLVDIYKKTYVLIRTQEIANRFFNQAEESLEFNKFVEKLKSRRLDQPDKKMLEEAFKIHPENIATFCEEVSKIEDSNLIRSHLKGRVQRALISHKISLTASVVDFVASALVFGVFFVAPPVGAVLTVANGAFVGSASLMKIGVFMYDWQTERMKLEA